MYTKYTDDALRCANGAKGPEHVKKLFETLGDWQNLGIIARAWLVEAAVNP